MFAEFERTDGRWCLINPQDVSRVEQASVSKKAKVVGVQDQDQRPKCLIMQAGAAPEEAWIEIYGERSEVRDQLIAALRARFQVDPEDYILITSVVNHRMREIGMIVPAGSPAETTQPDATQPRS